MKEIEVALAIRTGLERAHLNDPDFEVVLLASESEQALLKTHARYFKNAASLATKD